ncbi:MAG: GIY-YIG nuclease family protein [Bacteroidota bacterium]
MFYVYVLWSERLQKRYVGSAEDPKIRLAQHNEGRNRFTKGGIPWVIIHIEEYPDLSSARKRESFLKSGAGRASLDKQFPQYRRKKL